MFKANSAKARPENEFSYRIIVFALLQNIRLDDHPLVKSLFRKRSVFISEHPIEDESQCEYTSLHYHGIIEFPKENRFDNDRVILDIKKHCTFFKSQNAIAPINFMAYMQVPPRHIIFKNTLPNSLLDYILSEVTQDLINSIKQKKELKLQQKKGINDDIAQLMKLIKQTRAQSESELVNYFYSDPDFREIYTKRTFSLNFKKALQLEMQSCLDTPILVLAKEFVDHKNICLTPKESVNLVMKWCRYQKIDMRNFILNILMVMDRCKKKRNSLYLCGEPNSGKTYIVRSLQKAAYFYGEVNQGTASYTFMWQDCVNKRLIVINEPYFDNAMIEQLKVILEGTGTFVHKKMSSDEYLRPTPVIITSNTKIWALAPGSKAAITARLIHLYDNLKSCPFLQDVTKDLHPLWLNHLADKFLTHAEKEDFSFILPSVSTPEVYDVEDDSTYPTSDSFTQTGLQCREASPVSDFSLSPIPSPNTMDRYLAEFEGIPDDM